MNDISNEILIAKFLRNELTEGEKAVFSEKMRDQAFQDELQLQMAIYKALEEDDKKEFEEVTKESLSILSQKSKTRKMVFAYSAVASLAAILLIVFVIIKPFSDNEMDEYIAMAEPPFELSITKVRSIRAPGLEKDSTNIFVACEKIMIASVPDKKLEKKYFFDGCTLYTYFNALSSVKVISDFDKDLNKIYYLKKDGENYRFSKTTNIVNQEIYEFVKVEN